MTVLEPFEEYLKTKLGYRSIKAYLYDLGGFLEFMSKRSGNDFKKLSLDKLSSHLKNVRQPDFYAYIYHLKDVEGNTEKTVNRKLTSLSAFYNFLTEAYGFSGKNPLDEIPRYKIEERGPEYIDEDMVKKILSKVRPRNECRDKAILLLIAQCAMKASRIVSLKLKAYDGKHLNTESGIICLSKGAIDALDKYIQMERKRKSSQFLFTSQKNDSISIRTIQHIIKNIGSDLNTEKSVTSETIRNTTIMNLLKNSADKSEVKRYFGQSKSLKLEKALSDNDWLENAPDFDFSKQR